MRYLRTHILKTDQQGQAATEFIVVAVFLLIPLFLIIPLLGKYIDIKHAAINKARFEAWEYTVWNGPKEDIKNDIDASQSAGKKTYAVTQAQGKKYFFSDPTSSTYGTPEATFSPNPLWTDHRGDSLFSSNTAITGSIVEIETEHSALMPHILSDIIDIISDILTLFGDVMEFMHVDAKFDAMYTKGYFSSTVNVEVRSLEEILPVYSLNTSRAGTATDPLIIKAKAAVLSNNWNAGSTDNVTSESRGLVLTAVLKPITDTINIVVSTINSLTSKVPGLKVKLPAVPDFGYVKDDLIPYEHLKENTKELRNKEGLYYYHDK